MARFDCLVSAGTVAAGGVEVALARLIHVAREARVPQPRGPDTRVAQTRCQARLDPAKSSLASLSGLQRPNRGIRACQKRRNQSGEKRAARAD
jgi:hypothetical protein